VGGGGGGQEKNPMPPSRKTQVRRRATEPSQSRQEGLPVSRETPPLLSDSEPKREFMVKETANPAMRAAKRAAENNRIVAENLVDLIATLVAEGVLDAEAWLKPTIALERLLENGSSSPSN